MVSGIAEASPGRRRISRDNNGYRGKPPLFFTFSDPSIFYITIL
jgi:hypothetical protein